MYQPRTYRHWIRDRNLISFSIVVKETDLCIRASTNLKRKAFKLVTKYRDILERYIERHPDFLTALKPLPVNSNAPCIVKVMSASASSAGTGPMAGVAGAIAEFVGNELLPFSPEIIVENGGDIYLKSLKKRLIGIYAGKSPLTGLSYGKADAVIVLSKSATLADAAATAIGNLIEQPSDVTRGIEMAQRIEGLKGAIIIADSNMGLWGEVKLRQISLQDQNKTG